MPVIGEIAAFAFASKSEQSEEVSELRNQGWIACEGQSVAQKGRIGLPKLFARLKTTWGSVDPNDVFNLPDLRGRFLRGWDHGAGIDPEADSRTKIKEGATAEGDSVGSEQGHMFAQHNHGMRWEIPVPMTTPSPDVCAASPSARDARGGSDMMQGGKETRPRKASVLYCVYTGDPLPKGLKFFAP